MRNRIFWLICITILLFIGINIFLLFKFEKEVTLTKSVSDIKNVATSKMQTLHKTDGVVAPANEVKIFNNPSLGTLDKISAQEGQEVSAGEVLLSYSNIDYEASRTHLEGLIDQSEEEVELLEDAITELRGLKTTIETFSASDDEMKEEIEQTQDEKAARVDVEIADKNHQIQVVETKIDGYETQLDAIEEHENQLEITSPVNGIVKEISQTKDGPVITIYETPFVVRGQLKEEETPTVLEGQMAYFTTDVYGAKKFDGLVANVAQLPADKPEISQKSKYPFTITFEETSKKLQAGFHVDIAIVTAENENALTIPKKAILTEGKKKYLFVINTDGKVEKRKISIGLKENAKIEVTKGVKVGELVITSDLDQLSTGNAIVKQIEIKNLSKDVVSKLRKRKIARLITEGFLQN